MGEWYEVLAAITGRVVHGQERISTDELLTKHLGVPVTIVQPGDFDGRCVGLGGARGSFDLEQRRGMATAERAVRHRR